MPNTTYLLGEKYCSECHQHYEKGVKVFVQDVNGYFIMKCQCGGYLHSYGMPVFHFQKMSRG